MQEVSKLLNSRPLFRPFSRCSARWWRNGTRNGAAQISRYALLRQYPIGAREGTSPLELNIGAALVAAPLNLSVSGQECRCDVQGL